MTTDEFSALLRFFAADLLGDALTVRWLYLRLKINDMRRQERAGTGGDVAGTIAIWENKNSPA